MTGLSAKSASLASFIGLMSSLNRAEARQLHDALEKLTKAIREVEAVVETMRAEHDPLASHIFVSRRHYQNVIRYKEREAARDVGAVKLANRLRTRVSRQFGRMGAVDGCGCASVAHANEVRPRQFNACRTPTKLFFSYIDPSG